MIRATLFFTHFKERTRVISQIVEESTTPSSVCNRRLAFLGADIKEYYTNEKVSGCCEDVVFLNRISCAARRNNP